MDKAVDKAADLSFNSPIVTTVLEEKLNNKEKGGKDCRTLTMTETKVAKRMLHIPFQCIKYERQI